MNSPRILLLLDTSRGWSRDVALGFSQIAHQRGWTLLRYDPDADFDRLVRQCAPDAVVLGPGWTGPWPSVPGSKASVSVNADRSSQGVASVCLDEQQIADEALAHLQARGLRRLAAVRFDASPFALARERRFVQVGRARGARVLPSWTPDGRGALDGYSALTDWLRALEKPCGVFAGCDHWALALTRCAKLAGIRVPEDLAIIGVDNDPLDCELSAPALTSVDIPWRSMGEHAARLVREALDGGSIAGRRIVLPPGHVLVRRSTDTLAIEDELVAAAIAWIHEHADRRLDVPTVVDAVATTRQRLERRFRSTLGRTIMDEVRLAHVERAKQLLATSTLPLSRVAVLSGFANPSLLSVAFRRELGMPPGVYRRRVHGSVLQSQTG